MTSLETMQLPRPQNNMRSWIRFSLFLGRELLQSEGRGNPASRSYPVHQQLPGAHVHVAEHLDYVLCEVHSEADAGPHAPPDVWPDGDAGPQPKLVAAEPQEVPASVCDLQAERCAGRAQSEDGRVRVGGDEAQTYRHACSSNPNKQKQPGQKGSVKPLKRHI